MDMNIRICVLCLNDISKDMMTTENECEPLGVRCAESFCRFLKIQTDVFLSYLHKGAITFCRSCNEVLKDVHDLVEKVSWIQQQLSKIRSSVLAQLQTSTTSAEILPSARTRRQVFSARKTVEDMRHHLFSSIGFNDSPAQDIFDFGDSGTSESNPFQELDMDSLEDPSFPELFDEVEDVKIFPVESSEEIGVRMDLAQTQDTAFAGLPDCKDEMNFSAEDSDSDPDYHPEDTYIEKRKKEYKALLVLHCPKSNCEARFKAGQEDRLAAHVKRKHQDEDHAFKCPHCSESYNREYAFMRHIQRRHSRHVTNMCNTCGNGFPSEQDLLDHQKLHVKPAHPCTICSRSFVRPCLLKYHMSSAHHLPPPARKYLCELCSRNFPRRRKLDDHQQKFHASELNLVQHKCQTCGKVLCSKFALKIHMQVHERDGWQQCTLCDFKVASNSKMRGHIAKCHPNRNRECTFEGCSAVFTSKYGLKLHLQCHINPTPYLCSECPKTFRRINLLRNHEQAVHSGLTPHQCTSCGQRFAIRKYLLRHFKNHHPNEKLKDAHSSSAVSYNGK